MQPSDNIALAGVIVSAIGVIVTGALTCVIALFAVKTAKATTESAIAAIESAKAAKANNELSQK